MTEPASPSVGKRRLRTGGLLLAISLVVLAMTPGLVSLGGGSRTFAQLAPGDCVRLAVLEGGNLGTPQASAELVHEEVPCSASDEVSYLVGTVAAGSARCPNDFYLDYFTTGVDNPEHLPRQFTACLVPNFPAGVCVGDDAVTHGYALADCTPEALFQVAESHDVDAPEICAEPTRPMNFPIPPRTYCLAEVR